MVFANNIGKCNLLSIFNKRPLENQLPKCTEGLTVSK